MFELASVGGSDSLFLLLIVGVIAMQIVRRRGRGGRRGPFGGGSDGGQGPFGGGRGF
jgi:hypothetical protein